MAYQTLYRAWRPQTFDQVLGQDHVCRTLQNAIASGRLAHAYLFCGPRGTGKTSTAKILAKAINCEHGPTAQPCDECSLCVRIRDGYCLDVLEMDAASTEASMRLDPCGIKCALLLPKPGTKYILSMKFIC